MVIAVASATPISATESKRTARNISFASDLRTLLLGRSIGIDHGAALVLRRPQNRLHAAVAKLFDIARGHMLELRKQGARSRPGAVFGIIDLASHGVEAVVMDVMSEFGV